MILHILLDIVSRSSSNLPYEKVDGEIRCISDLAPFEIPDTWEWCRVGDLFTNMSGLAYKKDSLNIKSDNMVRVLRGGNIGNEEYYFKDDDVWISSEFVKSDLLLKKNYMITPAVSSLEHIGKIALIDKDYSDTVVGGFVLMLIPYFCDDELSRYLLYAFDAKNHRDNCRNITHKSGQAFYNLSRERLMNLPVPLPPMEELKRINAQLKNILPFVSEYATIDDKINTLNKGFPDVLKKSILQQAVMGKLVPQDASDEPASVLLDRIRAEKQALIKAGKLKKDKHESIIYRRDNSHYEKLDGVERCIDDEIPFEIPQNWVWCRLSSLGEIVGGGTPKTEEAEYWNGGTIAWLTPADMKYVSGKYVSHGERFITNAGLQGSSAQLMPKGTVVYSSRAPIGYVAISLNEICTNQGFKSLIPAIVGINQYIYYCLIERTPEIQSRASGTTFKEISGSEFGRTLIPLPPMNEQKRIVTEIERILPLCDKL